MASLIQAAGKTIRNCGLGLVVFGLFAMFLPNYAGMTMGVILSLITRRH